jgi:hypothetical protein
MHRPPDPEMRSPAAANGRANRKSKCSAALMSKYSPDEIDTSVAVYFGRNFLGTIDLVGGLHHARSADGADLGTYKNRTAAARAFNEGAHG